MSDDISKVLSDEADRMDAERNADVVRNYVRPQPPRDPSQVYSVRLPVHVLDSLRQHAEARGMTPSALIRRWVVERLADERDVSEERGHESRDPRIIRVTEHGQYRYEDRGIREREHRQYGYEVIVRCNIDQKIEEAIVRKLHEGQPMTVDSIELLEELGELAIR